MNESECGSISLLGRGGKPLKIQVQPRSEIFDPFVKELSIGRMSLIVLKQETNLPHKTLRPFKLKAAADGNFRAPPVFLSVLHVQSRDEAG